VARGRKAWLRRSANASNVAPVNGHATAAAPVMLQVRAPVVVRPRECNQALHELVA
jgi:hypothetical protein